MGGISLAEHQRDGFTDRIRRIEAGGPNTSGTIYAGIDEKKHVPLRKRRRRAVSGAPILVQVFMIPFALLAGAGAMLAGRVGAFHAMADPELLPADYAGLFSLTGDIGIAVAIATFVVLVFDLGHGARLIAFMLGFLGVMLGETQMIAHAPEAFAAMFSDSYVQTAVANAPADPFTPEALGL